MHAGNCARTKATHGKVVCKKLRTERTIVRNNCTCGEVARGQMLNARQNSHARKIARAWEVAHMQEVAHPRHKGTGAKELRVRGEVARAQKYMYARKAACTREAVRAQNLCVCVMNCAYCGRAIYLTCISARLGAPLEPPPGTREWPGGTFGILQAPFGARGNSSGLPWGTCRSPERDPIGGNDI